MAITNVHVTEITRVDEGFPQTMQPLYCITYCCMVDNIRVVSGRIDIRGVFGGNYGKVLDTVETYLNDLYNEGYPFWL